MCAGTDTFGEILQKEFGFCWLAYSDVLRDVCRERGIEITRKNLQDLGNELRARRGVGVLSELLIEKMEIGKDYVIGNIRNPGEVEVLREKFGGQFILVRLDAAQKIRFDRLLKRRREKDPQTWGDFLKVEERDFGINEEKSGQQHSAVFALADFTLDNNESFADFRSRVRDFIFSLRGKV